MTNVLTIVLCALVTMACSGPRRASPIPPIKPDSDDTLLISVETEQVETGGSRLGGSAVLRATSTGENTLDGEVQLDIVAQGADGAMVRTLQVDRETWREIIRNPQVWTVEFTGSRWTVKTNDDRMRDINAKIREVAASLHAHAAWAKSVDGDSSDLARSIEKVAVEARILASEDPGTKKPCSDDHLEVLVNQSLAGLASERHLDPLGSWRLAKDLMSLADYIERRNTMRMQLIRAATDPIFSGLGVGL